MVTYPADWEKRIFSDFIKIKRGASPRPIDNYITNSPTGINWIKIGDGAKNSKYITSTAERIIPEGRAKSVSVNAGDFLLSNSMSFGRPYILAIDGCIHDGWLCLSDFDGSADSSFLFYLLLSPFVQEQYQSLAAGSGVQNLNKDVVNKVMVYLPSLNEQRAIAETLTQFDGMVSSLDALIEKKCNIREAALDDLVTGKSRLDGFSDNWKMVSFDEVITPKARIGWQGLKKDEYLTQGYSYLIGGTDFSDGHIKLVGINYVSKERYDLDENIQVTEDDVLVTKDGTVGKVAIVQKLNHPATLNSGVFVFRTKRGLHPKFLYRVLSSSVFKDFIDALSAGSTVKHLYQKDLKRFAFNIPSSVSEQLAIAETLGALDTEISTLETERDKWKQIRDGAMDDLLSGRVRLKNWEVQHAFC